MKRRNRVEITHDAEKLRKSRGPLAGVCGGLGEYGGIDPILVRIGFVVAIFFSFGVSILVYVLLAVFLPKANREHKRNFRKNNRKLIAAVEQQKTCIKCGAKNDIKRNFCSDCGEQIV